MNGSITFKLDEDKLKELQKICHDRGYQVASFVRSMVYQFLKDEVK